MRYIKTIILFILLAQASLFTAQIPFTCEGQFLLTLANNGDSRLALVQVDPVTNNVTFGIINNSMRVDINAIGYRNEENLIYGLDPNDHFLFRVDAVGSVENLGRLPLDRRLLYFAADITPDGRYMILIGGTSTGVLGRDEELVRVDLATPGYPVERMPVSGDGSRIYDLAFHPLTGVLYGFDSNNERLVEVNPNTGRVSANWAPTANVDNAGSLFFDAFGNLYAYGGPALSPQNRFYSVDLQTGAFTILAGGPNAEGTDACSCPYTVEMKKTVSVEWTYPCKEVEYKFIIANGSGKQLDEVNFIDPLPNGMTFSQIIDNPFGGVVASNPGDGAIRIDNLTLPVGIDTIKALVYVGNIPEGTYLNQARLSNLPLSLGQVVRSDEPRTLAEEDSTYLDVRRIPFESMSEDYVICDGEVVEIDLSSLGESFLWSDGSTSPVRNFTDAQNLSVDIAAGCDSAFIDYTITEEDIELFLPETEYNVNLGDTIIINPTVVNTGFEEEFIWYNPDGEIVDCGECSTFEFVPLFSGVYRLVVVNEFGCRDEALIQVIVNKNRQIYVPNAITPNFDNINDILFIFSKNYGKIENLTIFDRWGELIYQNGNFFVNEEEGGWDGTFQGQVVMPGVYTWMAEITFLDDETEFFSGDVTVIR